MISKKILVTGATGFLGGHLVKALLKKGYNVFFIARNKVKAKSLIELGAKMIHQDIEEEFFLEESFDIVYHCAALSSPWGSYKDFYQANVLGTKNLIKACSCSGLFIHVSSPSIYFNFSDRLNVKETDSISSKPANHYVETKILAEREVLESGIKHIILRPRGIFGPGDISILPRIMKMAQSGFFVLANPDAIVDITYIDNLVDAMLSCIDLKRNGQIYNISNSENLTIKEILESLFEKLDLKVKFVKVPFFMIFTYAALLEFIARYITKKEPKLTRYSAGIISKSLSLDINTAKRDLTYNPRISIEEGLTKFVASIKGEKL